MRHALIWSVFAILTTSVRADPIHYDQIPADAQSYFHIDVEQVMTARLGQVVVNDIGTVNQNIDADGVNTALGGPIKSATIYSTEKGAVLLLRASTQGFHDKVESPHATNTIVFDYDHQEVRCSSTCMLPGLFGNGTNPDSSKIDEGPRLSIGLGRSASGFRGEFYTAYVGPDLIVMAVDLPAMAAEIDVLHASKPSLAQQDPQGMKTDWKPGMFAAGAGLSARLNRISLGQDQRGDRRNPSSQPVYNPIFGGDMFGQLKGKAKVARFAAGEEDGNEYMSATISMIDADSATQIKNLILGVKAFAQLSHETTATLLDPLEVESSSSDVNLRWAVSTAKLSGLFHISPSKHGHPASTSIPATEPGH